MIVLRVDVWPMGDHRRARDMGTVLVWNIGTDGPNVGRYRYKILKFNQRRRYEELLMRPQDIPKSACWREGTIEGFPRKRQGPLDLLYRILDKAIGYRSKKP